MPGTDENQPAPESSLGRRHRLENALELGPRKKASASSQAVSLSNGINFTSCLTDPLVHHGRHFGRTVHALCRVHAILNNGILRESDMLENEALDSEQ